MSEKTLESSALSVYCESIAMMLSAGIQTDEAVYSLAENMQDTTFKQACMTVYEGLVAGKTFAVAMADSSAFPKYAVDMIAVGEYSGRLEKVLGALSQYYREEDRLFTKVKNAVVYPAVLLGIMIVIILFTLSVILPVFISVYENLGGSLTTGSFSYVNASLVVGWVALVITLFCTALVIACALMTRTEKGRLSIIRMLEKLPFTKRPLQQLALGRFTSVLATYVASGVDSATALKEAINIVEHREVKGKIILVHAAMTDPAQMKGLVDAVSAVGLYDSVYTRMLVVGARSGNLESVLEYLSEAFVDDALVQMDNLIDSVEPGLAAFLTISVGATLIAVMLPLIGIMGAIG